MLSALFYSALGAVFTWLLTIQWLRSELRRMERHYEIAVGSWKDRYAIAMRHLHELDQGIDSVCEILHRRKETEDQ